MAMDFFYKAGGAILAPFKYAQREINEAKEDLKEDAQEALSKAIKLVIIGVFSLFFIVFISITAATSINDAMDSAWAGFAIVAGFYLLLALGVYIWMKATAKKKHEEEFKHHRANTVATH
jgi:amino acid transporter